MVLLDGLKHMAHGRGNYAGQGWAQVGQVDLTWTNIGPKELCLGLTIQVKVLGQFMLKRKHCLVIDNMHSKGKIDLRSILIWTYSTYNFIRNWGAPL